MFVKSELISDLNSRLDLNITELKAVSGACTNTVHSIGCADGKKYIVKSGSSAPNVFAIESASLKDLSRCSAIRVPETIFQSEDLLVLEYIQSGLMNSHSFTSGLEALHEICSPTPGYSNPTYLGHFLQHNASNNMTWPHFYWHHRIYPLYLKCVDRGLSSSYLDQLIVKTERNICDILPDLKSYSLIHGDLWSGNYFYDSDGKLVLIDPALYYGDPLCDLAMLDLFGGEESHLFESKLQTHHRRVELYKAYYLLYHLYDCGATYLDATCRSLSLLS